MEKGRKIGDGRLIRRAGLSRNGSLGFCGWRNGSGRNGCGGAEGRNGSRWRWGTLEGQIQVGGSVACDCLFYKDNGSILVDFLAFSILLCVSIILYVERKSIIVEFMYPRVAFTVFIMRLPACSDQAIDATHKPWRVG